MRFILYIDNLYIVMGSICSFSLSVTCPSLEKRRKLNPCNVIVLGMKSRKMVECIFKLSHIHLCKSSCIYIQAQ